MSNYSCGNCLLATARYAAVGNIPKHAHLCTLCWEQDKNREHYMKMPAPEECKRCGYVVCSCVKDLPPNPPLVENVDYSYPHEIEHMGAGSKAAALLANNSLYGKVAPKHAESGFLPINAIGTVASGHQTVITTQPQVQMVLTRLVVPRSIAMHFNLRGMQISNTQKFSGIGEVSMEIFWGDDERPDIPPILLDYRISPWHRVSLTIFNHSAMAQPFNATFTTENFLP